MTSTFESHLDARRSRSRTHQPPRRCKTSTTISIDQQGGEGYNPTSQGPSFLVWRQETKCMMLIDFGNLFWFNFSHT
jgi:hypothetical protein